MVDDQLVEPSNLTGEYKSIFFTQKIKPKNIRFLSIQMNFTQNLKELVPKLTPQQSQQLDNLYQEIMTMNKELEQLQQNNQQLQEQFNQKKISRKNKKKSF